MFTCWHPALPGINIAAWAARLAGLRFILISHFRILSLWAWTWAGPGLGRAWAGGRFCIGHWQLCLGRAAGQRFVSINLF